MICVILQIGPIYTADKLSVSTGYPSDVVQAFYRQQSVNRLLIAKEGFLTVLGAGICPL